MKLEVYISKNKLISKEYIIIKLSKCVHKNKYINNKCDIYVAINKKHELQKS